MLLRESVTMKTCINLPHTILFQILRLLSKNIFEKKLNNTEINIFLQIIRQPQIPENKIIE